MRLIKWTSILSAIVLFVACFLDWIVVESRGIVVSGMDAGGTSFGKPGLMHLLLTILFLALMFTPKVWARRWNLAVVALNLGWALRNYFLITICRGGECPTKLPGIYLVMICSVIMLLGALFTDLRISTPDPGPDPNPY